MFDRAAIDRRVRLEAEPSIKRRRRLRDRRDLSLFCGEDFELAELIQCRNF